MTPLIGSLEARLHYATCAATWLAFSLKIESLIYSTKEVCQPKQKETLFSPVTIPK